MDANVETIIYDKIREKCTGSFTEGELAGDTGIDTLPMDSLTVLELIYELEDQFNITVEEHLLTSMRTVEDLVKMFDDLTESVTNLH